VEAFPDSPGAMGGPVLAARGIRKSFGGVRALKGVDFEVNRREIHAVVGENGAGKTTLMMILSGVYPPDAGQVWLEGVPVSFESPGAARAAGVSTVFQELSLAPNLDVAENIFANRQPTRALGFIDRRRLRDEARRWLERVGLTCSPDTTVGQLSLADQQLVEIAKALSLHAKVLILDEPTSALAEAEVEKLFEIIRRLRDEGTAVVYISHKLKEVFDVADRATVLRDGERMGTLKVADVTPDDVIRLMVGRVLGDMYPGKSQAIGETVLEVRGLSREGSLHEVSLAVRAGEILGVAGLSGAGRTEMARCIFGIDRKDAGEVFLRGERAIIHSPEDAIRLGIGYLPEDRQTQGLFLQMSLRENVTAACLRDFTRLGFLNPHLAATVASDYVKHLRIITPTVEQQVANLSGGNQQKVLLAKWLATKPVALIADEPTRGVDVGAKAEIHQILRQFAAQGAGVIMISSELPEIMGMSDRIVVMHEGRITGEFDAAAATEEAIMACAAVPVPGRGEGA
jgi:ABC-type sugar transport system ATPase subunit